MNSPEQDLLLMAQEFELNVEPLRGQLACAFVGEWSHGKSSLINSLMGLPLLPADPIPTNKTVVRLSSEPGAEPHSRFYTDAGEMTEYTGQAAIDSLQQARQHYARIDYQAGNLAIPPGVVFIDTPGINDTDQRASTQAASVAADIVVFVMNPLVAAINQTQINFIQQVLLGKAEIDDLFFVFTHSDDPEAQANQVDLQQRLGSHIPGERVFFVSNTDPAGTNTLKSVLYAYLSERQKTLLPQRRQRYFRQLIAELEQRVKSERLALEQFRNKTVEQRNQLLTQIREAQRKESLRKSEIRERSRQHLNQTVQKIRDSLDQYIALLEAFIESSSVDQLQRKGYLQNKTQEIIEQQFAPFIRDNLEQLLKAVQGDIEAGQQYSSELLAELNLQLPVYQSPLGRVTAEQMMPIAVLGSVALFGWLSIPTLLLGYITLKAQAFGLIRTFDQMGLLDAALDKVKDIAASGYKQSVKMALAKTLLDYNQQIIDYCRSMVDKSTEQALARINHVEELEKRLSTLREESDKTLLEREIRLEKIEGVLKASEIVMS